MSEPTVAVEDESFAIKDAGSEIIAIEIDFFTIRRSIMSCINVYMYIIVGT